jgi:hypothetical protein
MADAAVNEAVLERFVSPARDARLFVSGGRQIISAVGEGGRRPQLGRGAADAGTRAGVTPRSCPGGTKLAVTTRTF